MYSYLMTTICRTGIFVICAQVLVHFRPNASYEKYMKMLVSAMILMQLFLPVSSFFTKDGEQSMENRVEWFEKQLEISMEQAVENYANGEKLLEQMTLEEVRIRLEESETQAEKENVISAIEIENVERIQIKMQEEQEGGVKEDGDAAAAGTGNARTGNAGEEDTGSNERAGKREGTN